MNRRHLIAGVATLPFITPARAALPWSARFIIGGFDGESYSGGLHIKLDEGWKTYWRHPGEAGIPPQIQAAQSQNLESLSVDFPLPQRIVDESGEAYGYHTEVIFPLRFRPIAITKPLKAQMTSFFGVCAKVCTPAQFGGDVQFMPSSQASADADLIAVWQAKIPRMTSFATAANVQDGHLVLTLNQPLDDIFVEGPERYYFQKPDFSKESGKAWIKISGFKTRAEFNVVALKLTANAAGHGLEQMILLG